MGCIFYGDYWLKLHQFADTMDISILNNLLEEYRK